MSVPPSPTAPVRPALRICQIETLDQFERYRQGLDALLRLHQAVLLDDFSGADPSVLVRNTATYRPWLWVLVDEADAVYGLACLTDVIPGRHAFVHGVSHPGIRRHPGVDVLGRLVLAVAFERLGVAKVKAEIEAHNRGALGYCRRLGFRREAHFRCDNRLQGRWQDVYVYTLNAPGHASAQDASRHPS